MEAKSGRCGYLGKVILVTGATGYVGGRLVPWLLEDVEAARAFAEAARAAGVKRIVYLGGRGETPVPPEALP
jgi:nucleoside-diphosphate-sugar epimerase